MAKEKVEKKSEAANPVASRQARWEAHCAELKAYNPSVYDTMGGDAQLEAIPESFK